MTPSQDLTACYVLYYTRFYVIELTDNIPCELVLTGSGDLFSST